MRPREERGRVGLEAPDSGTAGCDVLGEPSTGSVLRSQKETLNGSHRQPARPREGWKIFSVWVLDAWGPGDHATPSPIGRSSLIKH